SHLPNGIQILDDKWALARLLSSSNSSSSSSSSCPPNRHFVALESHCFRGRDFETFATRVGLTEADHATISVDGDATTRGSKKNRPEHRFEDLMSRPPSANSPPLSPPPPSPKNLWVVKDALSNGAGGIWIVDPTNVRRLFTSPTLHPDHRYVAQRYAWPPVLYRGRKCHVRVYGLLTCDGKAYVHRRAFLHVANDPFEYDDDNYSYCADRSSFEPSVHITNCCANSHDADRFAGEICVDLATPGTGEAAKDDKEDANNIDSYIPLGDYFPSIAASLATLAERAAPFLRGGDANSGFEYLGLDFLLSSVPDDDAAAPRLPVAYLLEANSPPSQDTATGLARAEELHDRVVSDLLTMWVLPRLGIGRNRECGGWKCVYDPAEGASHPSDDASVPIAPSKAAILNKIRWAMFERKAARDYCARAPAAHPGKCQSDREDRRQLCDENGGLPTEECPRPRDNALDDTSPSMFVRSQFPYFANNRNDSEIFFESGGGSQVPEVVVNAMRASLSNRDRSVVGAKCLRRARRALASLLIGSPCSNPNNNINNDNNDKDGSEDPFVTVGSNATSLLERLAYKFRESGALAPGDDIVIASENHMANVQPWLTAVEASGCNVKWWTLTETGRADQNDDYGSGNGVSSSNSSESSSLSDLVTDRTKVVAVSHASNILGCVRDISSICRFVHTATNGNGTVVVDGVAAAPHLLSHSVFSGGMNAIMSPDWYVVSLHKMYGPHLGCLIGKRDAVMELQQTMSMTSSPSDETLITSEIYKSWELGTVNYEACAGACALQEYFSSLARHLSVGECSHPNLQPSNEMTSETSRDCRKPQLPTCDIVEVSSTTDAVTSWIHGVEDQLIDRLLGYLKKCAPDVRIIEDTNEMKITPNKHSNRKDARLPIVSFVHARISSRDIVQYCRKNGVICRSCRFLSTERFWRELNIEDEGVVRFSLAHYNTLNEVDRAIGVLESLDKWRK
ncbi:hypothetical protein ACHAXS_007384, partial [Conticribra weissflogii]